MAAPALTGRLALAVVGWAAATLAVLGPGVGPASGAIGSGAVPAAAVRADPAVPMVAGCALFPASSYWNTPIGDLDSHPRSADWVEAIGRDAHVHPDFGSGLYDGRPIGIPYTVVGPDQSTSTIPFTHAEESDPGPYPMPDDPLIEGGPDSEGDRHVLLLQTSTCLLHELFAVHPDGQGGWTAGSGAVFDLSSNALRPDGWTSADAAGLPILPGLVRYEEVAAGEINHALRITAPRTDRSYVWPARHHAGVAADAALPPMGARFRLTDAVDPAHFPAQARPVVVALQTYGAVLADNGSAWFVSGVPDPRWDNDQLASLRDIPGWAWEAVDTTPMMVDVDSGRAAGAPVEDPAAPGRGHYIRPRP